MKYTESESRYISGLREDFLNSLVEQGCPTGGNRNLDDVPTGTGLINWDNEDPNDVPTGSGLTPYSAIDQDIFEAYSYSRDITAQLVNIDMVQSTTFYSLEGEIVESTEAYNSDTSTEDATVLDESDKSDESNKESSSDGGDDQAPPSRNWYKWFFLAGAIFAGVTMGFLLGPYVGVNTNLSIIDNSKALYKLLKKNKL